MIFVLSACGAAPVENAEAHALSTSVTLAATCSGCHVSGGGAIPSLEGVSEAALAASLRTYKSDTNGTSTMHRLARGYSDEEIDAIAAYLGAEAGE